MEPSAVAEDELQELIDDNFTLYKKIVDNDAFASLLFDSLFGRCVETVEENNEYPPPAIPHLSLPGLLLPEAAR